MIKIFSIQIFVLLIIVFPSTVLGQSETVKPVSLEQALKTASDKDKKILVDVYAEWCPYCQRMHSDVYTSKEVKEAISNHFVLVKINIESDNLVNYNGTTMTEAEFAQALENKNIPTTYFLNDEGAIIGVQPGFLNVDVFSKLLNFVGSDAYLSKTFDEYQNQR